MQRNPCHSRSSPVPPRSPFVTVGNKSGAFWTDVRVRRVNDDSLWEASPQKDRQTDSKAGLLPDQ